MTLPKKDTYVPTMRAFDDLTLEAKKRLDALRPRVHTHVESHRKRHFDECPFCQDRVERQAHIAECRKWLDREVAILLEKAQQKTLKAAAATAEANHGVR